LPAQKARILLLDNLFKAIKHMAVKKPEYSIQQSIFQTVHMDRVQTFDIRVKSLWLFR